LNSNPAAIAPQNLKEAVASAGYDLLIDESENSREEFRNLEQRKHKLLSESGTAVAIFWQFRCLL